MEMFGSVCLLVAIYGCVAELKSGCNQTVTLNETETTVTLSDFKLNSTTCTWRLEADKVTSTIVVHVVFVRLTGSLDRVVALDGPYTNRSVIKQCGFECTLNDSLMVSSGNTMLFITELDENPDIRIVSVKAWAQENGGRYNNNGNISVKNGTSSKAYFQLHSTNNNQVQVLLKESTLSPGSLIQIYDGSSETDQTLAILSSSTDFVPITSSKQDLLIVTSNIVGQQYLFGDFSTVQPGCHVVSSGQSGDFILARNNFKSQCDWLINPSLYAGNIMLEIRSVDLCENENLVIYEGLSTFGQKLATVTKATGSTSFPKFTASAGKGLSVFLSAFVNCTSDVPFSGSYWIVPECSADLQTSGTITSPQYPSQYPLNAVCTWPTPTKNTTSSFYMTFNNLDLAIGHNVTVENDLTTLMIYTGSDLPGDLVTQVKNSSTISIVFDSNTGTLGTGLEIPGRGFNLSYKVLDCGDSISSNNGRIDSKSAIPADAKECIWIVTVPPKSGKSVNIVSFTIDIAGIANWQNLELRDGCSVRSPLLNQGVSMVKTLSFLTRYNKLWIHYRKNATGSGDMADKLFSFNLTYNTYSCDENHVCKNGICLHPDWRCNGVDDCGDNSDELGCGSSAEEKQVKIWLAAVIGVVCFLIGVVIAIAAPAIYKRCKYPNYSQLKDMMDPAIS